jgi:hypothetical protein
MDPKNPAARPIRGHLALTRLLRILTHLLWPIAGPKFEPKTINAKTESATNFFMIIFRF